MWCFMVRMIKLKGILILILTDWPQDGTDFFQLHMLTKHPSRVFAHSW